MKKDKNKNTPAPIKTTEPFDAGRVDDLKLGQWYWVNDEASWGGETDDDGKKLKEGQKYRWLGCVMEIGSNYVKLKSPPGERGSSSVRVHFDEFDKELTPAPEADQYIADRQGRARLQVRSLLEEVRALTAKLGVVPTRQIADDSDDDDDTASGEGQNALVVVSSQPDTKAYKNALVKAAEKTLPALFAQIKEANQQLAKWMLAPTMPLEASIGPMEQSIGAVKERIYTIELYAGLTEEAVKCCDGEPAAIAEKLHVMQRRLYMDEECLANYEAGGMEFKDIEKFDAWLSRPENRDRLLPFPRTLVAFRVRRHTKDRESDGNIRTMFVNFSLEDADKTTFLYVRNGEQLWRVDCDFVFDEMIIPNKDQFDPGEPMMVKVSFGRIDEMMPKKRWESLVAEEAEQYRKYKEWEKANPGDNNWIENPFHKSIGFRHEYKHEWKPFDQTNVYFDDVLREIEAEIKKYNRIAVIVQGLFDRSEVLHPHVPVRMWEPDSFARSVELVYDAVTLTHGDKPDFEAFREKLNAQITPDSILVGQEDYWLRREAERENKRIRNDYRHRGTHPNYKRYRPDDSPGPGYVGKATEWKARSRKAVFRWTRESRDWRRPRYERPDAVKQSVEVPANELLNVSAYKPGDFKQFFSDPRTRREYLKWAPLLLAAEDYHAGKVRDSGGGTVYGVRY